MKQLFKIYRTRLFGLLLLSLGISLVLTTLIFFFPNNNMDYMELFYITLKYISIIIIGFVLLLVGVALVINDEDSEKLINNFKNAFKNKK